MLLKGEKDGSSGGASDSYQDLLEREGFQVTMVPVLQFNFVNSSRIPPMLTLETASSLVLTSPRAVIALSKSLQEESAAEVLKSWREKKVFCVGPSTAKTTKVLFDLNDVSLCFCHYRSCLVCLRWERTLGVQQS